MKNRKNKILLGLASFALLTFLLGKYFDSRCQQGCIAEAVTSSFQTEQQKSAALLGLQKTLNDFNISLNMDHENFHVGSSSSSSESEPDGAFTASFKAKSIRKIKVEGVITNWTIKEAETDQISITFKDYRSKQEWKLNEGVDQLHIEASKEGPALAELIIPKQFSGEIEFNSVSGNLNLSGLGDSREFILSNVSGNLNIEAAPQAKFSIQSVSGDIDFSPAHLEKNLELSINAVSGDVDAFIANTITGTHFETVSGDIKIKFTESAGFNYSIEGLITEIEGLPDSEPTAARDLTGVSATDQKKQGSFGPQAQGKLTVKTVSGNVKFDF